MFVPRLRGFLTGLLFLAFFLSGARGQAPVPSGDETLAAHVRQSGWVEDLAATPWRLWQDEKALWQNDPLFLPGEVNLSALPVNPPTGGWATLDKKAGISVPLPASTAQYFGDHQGDKPVTGVAWFWRTFTAPPVPEGQRLLIRFRSARLRAEVYVNGKLCAYNLLTELPFIADVTDAVKSGSGNVLAVRITNPGGNMAWSDWSCLTWGNYQIPLSRGIGGLDAGIELLLRNQTEVSDLAVYNHPEPGKVTLTAEISEAVKPYAGPVAFSIQREGKTVWQGQAAVQARADGTPQATIDVTLPDAALWDTQHPNLYTAQADLPGLDHASRRTDFGFRFFTAKGIGTNAMLRLNGKRIVVRSAIEFGWWGGTGLWPTAGMVHKEVTDAQALGLNCIQAHRNLVKEDVVEWQDRTGLLRYEEPGSGQNEWLDERKSAKGVKPSQMLGSVHGQPTQPPLDVSGTGGEPATFAQKYEFAKIMAMVKRDRNHPSLIVWSMQNEVSASLANPKIFYLLRQVHAADPSRIVLLKSGNQYWNQAFMLPYDDTVYHEDGKKHSGWRDEHDGTPKKPGTWTDDFYLDPLHYYHRVTDAPEIAMWGEEMATGVSDNHAEIVKELNGATAYDSAWHAERLADYERFMDRWKFRAAFPTASDLFQAIGVKSYDFWARRTEMARFSNLDDYFVINSWESTAGDCYSGLVDSYRNFKSDSAVMKRANAPEVLVIEPRRSVFEPGEQTLLDIFLINETNRKGKCQLTIQVPGSPAFQADVDVTGGDTYGQLLHEAIPFQAPAQEGTIRVTATLTSSTGDASPLTGSRDLLVIDHGPKPTSPVAVLGDDTAAVLTALHDWAGVEVGDPAQALVCVLAGEAQMAFLNWTTCCRA